MKNYNDIVEKKRKKNSGYIKKKGRLRLWGYKAVKIKKRGYKKGGCKDEKKGAMKKRKACEKNKQSTVNK